MKSIHLMNLSAPARGMLLAALSILTGLLAGAIGYLIGQVFYVLFLYPFILLVIGAILFYPSLRFFATSRSLFNAFCGLLLGLMILLDFHSIEYALFRQKNIDTFEISRGMNHSAAAQAVDAFLQQETGLSGLGGFVKYQDSQMNPYVYYALRSGRVAHTLKIYLHGRTGWAYLAGEAAVLLGGGALVGFLYRRFAPAPMRMSSGPWKHGGTA
ncbi:MAG TPA: hypothetical protein VLX61_00830 [Anaerolineales bacterium]|nr:hypothetical protein [Anaerolineales bacterium]